MLRGGPSGTLAATGRHAGNQPLSSLQVWRGRWEPGERGGRRSPQLPRLLSLLLGPSCLCETQSLRSESGQLVSGDWPTAPASSRERASSHTCAGERQVRRASPHPQPKRAQWGLLFPRPAPWSWQWEWPAFHLPVTNRVLDLSRALPLSCLRAGPQAGMLMAVSRPGCLWTPALPFSPGRIMSPSIATTLEAFRIQPHPLNNSIETRSGVSVSSLTATKCWGTLDSPFPSVPVFIFTIQGWV